MPRRHRMESKTSLRRIASVKRQDQALQLRIEGHNFDAIALQLGYKDRSGAYRAVMAALNRVPEPKAQEYRRINLERINKMRLENWPHIEDRRAMSMELSFQEREARYLGLDVPTKTALTDAEGGPIRFTLELGEKEEDNT